MSSEDESPSALRIKCDSSADAAYLHLRPDLEIKRTQPCGDFINLDWSADGILIGVEFMQIPILVNNTNAVRKFRTTVGPGEISDVRHNLGTKDIVVSFLVNGAFDLMSSYMIVDQNTVSITNHNEHEAIVTVWG